MRGGNLQDPVSEQSSTTHQTKRKHSPIVEQCRHNHMKKKKQQQRLTQISDEPQNMTSSGDLKPTQCSYEKKRKRNRRKSTSVEGHRRWVYSSRDMSSYKDKVVVVSYNILGVENALNHSDLYIEVPPQYLDWERRKKLIRKEINHYDSDILCFQEVDRFDDLDNLLEKDGFKGVYTARTGEACDGCAVFWKDKQFTLLHQENIEFREFDLRDNVAQLCVIKMKQNQSNADGNTQRSLSSSNRSFLVGNIHVLFNPNRGDIKLGQVRIFLEKAYKLSQEWGSIPIILSGDLNSVPQSAMYQFLAASELDIRLHDRRKISGQVESPSKFRAFSSHNKKAGRWVMSISKPLMYRWTAEELRLATGTDGVTHLQHQLKLCSAYLGIPGSCTTRDNFGEPLATSYHSMFMGTVDYIWHTEELVPVRVLETLPINNLRKTGGLPSERWGSDHLALVCELAFRSI